MSSGAGDVFRDLFDVVLNLLLPLISLGQCSRRWLQLTVAIDALCKFRRFLGKFFNVLCRLIGIFVRQFSSWVRRVQGSWFFLGHRLDVRVRLLLAFFGLLLSRLFSINDGLSLILSSLGLGQSVFQTLVVGCLVGIRLGPLRLILSVFQSGFGALGRLCCAAFRIGSLLGNIASRLDLLIIEVFTSVLKVLLGRVTSFIVGVNRLFFGSLGFFSHFGQSFARFANRLVDLFCGFLDLGHQLVFV